MADGALARELTLSVVSHQHGILLHRLLNDLEGHTRLHGVRVVVTLNVPEALDTKGWPRLELMVLRNERPQGFGANHNAAFQHCATPWFAVLNPDLRLPDDPFPALLDAARTQRPPGVVAPRILSPDGHVEDSARENLTPLSVLRRRFDPSAGRAIVQVSDAAAGREPSFFWLAGMFLLFAASAYRKVDGFDERYFMYCEDYDICARLRLAGAEIGLVPIATAVHAAQRNSHRSSRHLRWHLASLARVWTSTAFWRLTFGNSG